MEKNYSNSNNANSQRNSNSYKKREYANNSFQKKEYGNSERSSERPRIAKKVYSSSEQGSYTKKEYGSDRPAYAKKEYNSERPTFRKEYNSDRPKSNEGFRKSYNPNFKENSGNSGYKKPYNPNFKREDNFKKPFVKKNYNADYEQESKTSASGEIRLNKFIANAGICSRRNADIYITAGNVEVNGEVMTTLGYRVQPTDVVKFDGKVISSERKEYILLNKPKGFITTTSDEKGRKTVMDLVANATSARILPVGRLDRPTTGLLLLTNDGDLAKKLTHPTHGVRKIYHVVLDRKLDYKDFIKIEEGIELEDGFIQVDEISYVNDKPKNEIGVKIHSGRNRIVRRIFEHLGYEIEKLDRVVFAGLTKKDLPRGHWRKLTQQEIINLKNIK